MLTVRFEWTSMSLVNLAVGVLWLKMLFNLPEQSRLITFECSQIVIATLHDLLTSFFGC